MRVNEHLNNFCSDDTNELIISRARIAFRGSALRKRAVVYERKVIAGHSMCSVNEDTSPGDLSRGLWMSRRRELTQ